MRKERCLITHQSKSGRNQNIVQSTKFYKITDGCLPNKIRVMATDQNGFVCNDTTQG